LSRDALFSSFKAQPFGSGGFDGDVVKRGVEDVGDGLAHERDERGYLGLLSNDDAVDVADAKSMLVDELKAVAEEHFAVDVFVLGVVVGEVLSYVAEGGGAEDGVADGMEKYVGVGMAEEPFGVRDLDAAEPKRTVGD
jgi:hypothetical protein